MINDQLGWSALDAAYHTALHEDKAGQSDFRILPSRSTLISEIRGRVSSNRALRCLDIGAGDGYMSAVLARAFPRADVTALELSKVAVTKLIPRRAEALGVSTRVHAVEGSFHDLSSLDDFDIVVAFGALHHSPRLTQVFGQIASHLNQGGLLFAHEPVSPDSVLSRDLLDFYGQEKTAFGITVKRTERHDYFYRLSEYLAAAWSSGLELEASLPRPMSQLQLRVEIEQGNFARALLHGLRFVKSRLTHRRQMTPENRLFVWSKLDSDVVPHRV